MESNNVEVSIPLKDLGRTKKWRCGKKCNEQKGDKSTDSFYYQLQKPLNLVTVYYNEGKTIIYEKHHYYTSKQFVETECQRCKEHNFYPANWFIKDSV
jgi:hypothetical protein